MKEPINIDALEKEARESIARGGEGAGGMYAALIAPEFVLALIARLRAAEGRPAKPATGAEILDAFHRDLPNAFEDIDAIVAEIDEGRGEADACSCDQSLALQARVRELEAALNKAVAP